MWPGAGIRGGVEAAARTATYTKVSCSVGRRGAVIHPMPSDHREAPTDPPTHPSRSPP